MSWKAAPSGKRGRQRTYSDAAIQTCLTKALFGTALRRTTGFVESLLRLIGLSGAVPDLGPLCCRQKTLAVTISCGGSPGPLHPLIDIEPVSATGSSEPARGHRGGGKARPARKHGGPKRRVWRKLRLGVDERTLEVRAAEVTGGHVGDAPGLPDLLSQTPPDEETGSVTADGGTITTLAF